MTRRGLSLGLVADELTRSCLRHECHLIDLTPDDARDVLRRERPDMLLVESAWSGVGDAWKYRIASYPRLWLRNNRALRRMVAAARDLGIPTVFWNKEDGVHFGRFIHSARHFDHVFTVDANCLPRYRQVMGADASVHVLMFPVQPALHGFTGFAFRHFRANFPGSYSHHVHGARRVWQDMIFQATVDSGLGLTVFDRNSGRPSPNYRYPQLPGMEVLPAVSHAETARLYKDYLVSINVNTVTDSPTMYSRRLVEILACGGIAVTSPADSVTAMFADYCHVVDDPDQARALFSRLRHGPAPEDLERARAGSDYVLREHVWSRRLEQIAAVAGL